MLLANKVAIITGAARGIGEAMAQGYAAEGAKVVVADLREGDATVTSIRSAGGDAVYVKTDVTDERSCRNMVEFAVESFGGVDVLINNAAFYGDLIKKPFHEIDLVDWNRVMTVNAAGPFL